MSNPRHQEAWRLRKMARDRGQIFDIDLLPTAELQELMHEARDKRGMTWSELSRLTGIDKQTIQKIATTQKHVQRQNDRKIRYALADDFRAPRLRPVTAWHRQVVHSLAAQGWTRDHLEYILKNNGRTPGHRAPRTVIEYDHALEPTIRNIEWLAEMIGDKRGPSQQTATRQLRRGVFPLKHYTPKGTLNVRTLTQKQRQYVR